MFSTFDFFNKNPHKRIDSHADSIARWLLSRFRKKYPWLNRAIYLHKFDNDKFIIEWRSYLRGLTPFQLKRAIDYIDCNRTTSLAPSLNEFKQIIQKTSPNYLSIDELHKQAQLTKAVVDDCECDQCKKIMLESIGRRVLSLRCS